MTKRRRSYVPAMERRYLNMALKRLGHKRYSDYLASRHWVTLRRRLVRKRCERCGCGGLMHLHHETYRRLGAELPEDLCTLCPRCHSAVHTAARSTKSLAVRRGEALPRRPKRSKRSRKSARAVVALRDELDLDMDRALERDCF
jgi:ferredoxin